MGDEVQLAELNNVLELTDSIINKKYLSFLSNVDKNTYKLVDLQMKNLAVDINKHARIFHLKKFVYDSNESFLNKLLTVVNVAYALKGTIITTIQSDGISIDFYIGIVAKENKGQSGINDRNALLNAFEGTIIGNFVGSTIHVLNEGEVKEYSDSLNGNAICSVSVVPSLRDNKNGEIEAYVQGIENLVDSLRDKKYTILTIAEPISSYEISEIRHGYEHIHNYLSPMRSITESKGGSRNVTISKTDTENYVKGITQGISRTQTKTDNIGYSNGFNLGVSFIVSAGFNHSKTEGHAVSNAVTENTAQNEQYGKSRATGASIGDTSSYGTQVTLENRIIKSMLDRIEENIERINECERYGAFSSATYVIADEKETALNAAGNFISLMKGERSASQVSGINCWQKKSSDDKDPVFNTIISYLQHFTHPVFRVNSEVTVSTASLVSGPEITVQLGLPKKSINGLVVRPMNSFGRNVITKGNNRISLGKLFFMGRVENQNIDINLNSLASHMLVTGSTGKGKSNAIYNLLGKSAQYGIKFMVIEPAKGEYKLQFGTQKGVITYVTNPNFSDYIEHNELVQMDVRLLKINPFRFPDRIHVLEHIDRLVSIFNVCWPMYAAMPAILQNAIERAYEKCGWDLERSKNRYHERLYPSINDVINQVRLILNESEYSSDNKGDYIGSLSTRLKSLASGLNGMMLTADDWDDELLFDTNCIIDLSRIGSMETKSLIMGFLVIKLQEYRMQENRPNQPMKHITVIEEAHNLMKRTSTEQSSESANVAGKSLEMISNSIAEMRTYGEGFVIIDQSPGLLDKSVIRNTNTKIIFNVPDIEDRQLVGRAAGLTDNQINEVTKLERGVAVVYQNDWDEAVLCKFDKYDASDYHFEGNKSSDFDKPVDTNEIKGALIDCIMTRELYRKGEKILLGRLKKNVLRSKLDSSIKCAYLDYLMADECESIAKLRTLVYEVFDAEQAIYKAQKCSEIRNWINTVYKTLSPKLNTYDGKQAEIILSMIIYEKTLRDTSYNDILCSFTELVKRGEVII